MRRVRALLTATISLLLIYPTQAADIEVGNDVRSSGDLFFTVGGSERMRIDAAGRTGIGAAPNASKMLYVNGTFNGVNGVYVDSVLTDSQASWSTASATFVDLPGSSKSITIPAGTAIIYWTISCFSNLAPGDFRIRPVIGAAAPATGVSCYTNIAGSHKTYSGSWITATGGGAVTVKLQVLSEANTFQVDLNDQVTWALIVFRS